MIINSHNPKDLKLAWPPQEVFVEDVTDGSAIGAIRVHGGLVLKFFVMESYDTEDDSQIAEYDLVSSVFVPHPDNFFNDFQQPKTKPVDNKTKKSSNVKNSNNGNEKNDSETKSGTEKTNDKQSATETKSETGNSIPKD